MSRTRLRKSSSNGQGNIYGLNTSDGDNTANFECIDYADRLVLAKVVNRHRKDRMHSDLKLGWEMAQKILKEAKELGDKP